MAWLLDVNALIALIDEDHVYSSAIHRWVVTHKPNPVLTCPITETGAVRVMSQASYSNPAPITDIIEALQSLSATSTYAFTAEDLSIADESVFRFEHLKGPKQITDAYLLGLAHKRGWRLVSFGRSLPWQAVRGATPDLVFNPLDAA